MNAYIFQAEIYCEKCGEAIRKSITEAGNAPADPDNERTYDSDQFPKGPFEDGGGTSDTPQHCGSGPKCLDPTMFGGEPFGKFMENDLTDAGVEYVRNYLRELHDTTVPQFWRDYYNANGYTI